MTQEDKELLLKDLCARLPYGIKCYYNSPEIDDDVPEGISVIKGFQNEGILVEIESGDVIDIDYVKPYLRPMSSITENERQELSRLINDNNLFTGDPARTVCLHCGIIIDFHNSHYFDWRGLIPIGLALEAPEGMYK